MSSIQDEFADHLVTSINKFRKQRVPRKFHVDEALSGVIEAVISIMDTVPSIEHRRALLLAFIHELMDAAEAVDATARAA